MMDSLEIIASCDLEFDLDYEFFSVIFGSGFVCFVLIIVLDIR